MGCLRLINTENFEPVLRVEHSKNRGTESPQLDARLGRWMSPDPIFQPGESPYQSMDGNPINLTDVRGLDPGDPVEDRMIKGGLHAGWEVTRDEYNANKGKTDDIWRYQAVGRDENGKYIYARYRLKSGMATPIVVEPKSPSLIKEEAETITKADFEYKFEPFTEDELTEKKEPIKVKDPIVEIEDPEPPVKKKDPVKTTEVIPKTTFRKTNIKINVSFDPNQDELDSPTSSDWGSDDISEDIEASLKVLRANKESYVEIWPSTKYGGPNATHSTLRKEGFANAKELIEARAAEVVRQFMDIEPSLNRNQIRVIYDGTNYGSAVEFRSVTWEAETK